LRGKLKSGDDIYRLKPRARRMKERLNEKPEKTMARR